MNVTALIVPESENRILLGKRGTLKDDGCAGLYCTPGGRVEENETLEECCLREAKEECNIALNSMSFIGFVQPPGFIIFFYLVYRYTGNIQNIEPEKNGIWEFVDWNRAMTPGLELFKIQLRTQLKQMWRDYWR